MTIRDQILTCLKRHPNGIDDDDLANVLGLKHRQQANSRCRQLAKEGLIQRRPVYGKIHNFLTEAGRQPQDRQLEQEETDKPWFWEGHIQTMVVDFLEARDYTILFAADTVSRQPGKDIEAERENQPLWVTVKGYPKGTKRTRPPTQARHWFTHGLFDIVLWRGESSEAKLAFAMPDYPTYRKLAERVTWFQETAGFTYLWVREDGTVEIEGIL